MFRFEETKCFPCERGLTDYENPPLWPTKWKISLDPKRKTFLTP